MDTAAHLPISNPASPLHAPAPSALSPSATLNYHLIVTEHAPAVRAFLMAELREPGLAEEAAQETFVRGWTRLATLRTPEAVASWLHGIARRVAKEFRRDRQRRAAVELTQQRATPDTGTPADTDLERAVAALPQPYRDVVRLRYWANLSCDQVASRLNVPLGTVTKQLSRAHSMLRESMNTPSKTGATP